MQAEIATAFPVMSFASGATNSMRGAAHLSGLDDAMVSMFGGTTSDIGQLRHGFPREANAVVEVGGVRTLFDARPAVDRSGRRQPCWRRNRVRVGPLSVGYRLTSEALVFAARASPRPTSRWPRGSLMSVTVRGVAELPNA